MITRITQAMQAQQSISAVDAGLSRMSAAQVQLETGRKISVPSDDPTGTTVAMKAQASLAAQQQYQRNAQDGLAWLSTIDSTLQGVQSSLQRASTLALQGASGATWTQTTGTALSDEVDSLRQSILSAANTQYLGRPIFGGTTAGSTAYDDSGTYVGDDGSVNRRVGTNTVVQVNSSAQSVFGPDTDGGSNVFDDLSALSTALKTGDITGIQNGITTMQTDLQRVSAAQADEGARYDAINTATTSISASILSLQQVQSDAVNVDVGQATINLATQQTAYQAALAATSKTVQRSLLDFLQ